MPYEVTDFFPTLLPLQSAIEKTDTDLTAVAKATAHEIRRLDARIDTVQLLPGPQGEQGPPGMDGRDGADGISVVGRDGRPGRDGKDGRTLPPALCGAVSGERASISPERPSPMMAHRTSPGDHESRTARQGVGLARGTRRGRGKGQQGQAGTLGLAATLPQPPTLIAAKSFFPQLRLSALEPQ